MLLKFFKSNLPYVVVFIPILGIILWLPSLFPEFSLKPVASIEQVSPVYQWLTSLLQTNYYLSTIIALILCILQSYLLIRLNFKYIFIESKTYLPAVIFVLISSSVFSNQALQPALLANIFVLVSIDRGFLILKEHNQIKRYFESGLFIGIATIITPISVFIILIIWATLFVLKKFNWREWFASILGVLTPMALFLSIAYLRDNYTNTISRYIELMKIPSENSFSISNINSIALIIFALVLLIALLSTLRLIGTKKISSRKYYILFLWMLLMNFVLYLVFSPTGTELAYSTAIPLSIIFTLFFIELRSKWIAEIFFTLLFASIIIIIWL